MPDIPHAVLSDYFYERMANRRLRAAVFLTFRYDPAFFEEEILPILFDVPLSHVMKIRLVQLEDLIKELPGQIAVYYDANGLVSNSSSAKLDLRRISLHHPTGIFHPKNVLLLVESEESDENGTRAQTLIFATLSANLTRAGWWENVEACHVEEIHHGEKTSLKDDLIRLLKNTMERSAPDTNHSAIKDIIQFLRSSEQRQQVSVDGLLKPQLYCGGQSITQFIWSCIGDSMNSSYLEVIAPYFDDADTCQPLRELAERFRPSELRVFIPKNPDGVCVLRPELYDDVRTLENASWGKFSKEILRLGKGEDAGIRNVHAKIYRFFKQSPKREIIFVTSANLTTAAHQSRGNVETGILVEVTPLAHRPEFWMTREDKKPSSFQSYSGEDIASSGGSRLSIKFYWDVKRAQAYWDAKIASPKLKIVSRAGEFSIGPLEAGVWENLQPDTAVILEQSLSESSFLHVHGEGDDVGLILVQEDGMSHKPSILMSLSAADILRYWALLSPEQRAAFIESKATELSIGADELNLRSRLAVNNDTLFDRFAGFFHAFGCLERAVREALGASEGKRGRETKFISNEKLADYRLFGKKYDSLGSLLERIARSEDSTDDVDRYVIILCAQQLCQEMERSYPTYWRARAKDVAELNDRLRCLTQVKQRLIEQGSAGMPLFVEWFEKKFLQRAKVAEVEE